jgi:hypothetical protein
MRLVLLGAAFVKRVVALATSQTCGQWLAAGAEPSIEALKGRATFGYPAFEFRLGGVPVGPAHTPSSSRFCCSNVTECRDRLAPEFME